MLFLKTKMRSHMCAKAKLTSCWFSHSGILITSTRETQIPSISSVTSCIYWKLIFSFSIYIYIYTCLILLPLIFTFSLCLSHSVRFFSRSWGCSSGPERQRLFSHGQYSGGGRQKSSKPTQRQTHRKWQLELCGGESYTEGRRQGGLFRPIDLGRAKELTSELKREKARRIWKRKSSKRKADLWKPWTEARSGMSEEQSEWLFPGVGWASSERGKRNPLSHGNIWKPL